MPIITVELINRECTKAAKENNGIYTFFNQSAYIARNGWNHENQFKRNGALTSNIQVNGATYYGLQGVCYGLVLKYITLNANIKRLLASIEKPETKAEIRGVMNLQLHRLKLERTTDPIGPAFFSRYGLREIGYLEVNGLPAAFPQFLGRVLKGGYHEIGLYPLGHSIAVGVVNGQYSVFDSDLGEATFKSAKDLGAYIVWLFNTFYLNAIDRAAITTFYYNPNALFIPPERRGSRASCLTQ